MTSMNRKYCWLTSGDSKTHYFTTRAKTKRGILDAARKKAQLFDLESPTALNEIYYGDYTCCDLERFPTREDAYYFMRNYHLCGEEY